MWYCETLSSQKRNRDVNKSTIRGICFSKKDKNKKNTINYCNIIKCLWLLNIFIWFWLLALNILGNLMEMGFSRLKIVLSMKQLFSRLLCFLNLFSNHLQLMVELRWRARDSFWNSARNTIKLLCVESLKLCYNK